MILLLLLAFLMVAFIEIPDLLKNRWWKELAGFIFLLSLGFVLSLLIFWGVKLPYVSLIINHLIDTFLF